MDDYPALIADLLDRLMEQFHRDLETACEAALQTGTCGVYVEWASGDSPMQGPRYTIMVTNTVPYGKIYEKLP